MTDHPQPAITVNVDVTNPGQFFACCGLLELADRLWPGAEGWFEDNSRLFHMDSGGKLSTLVDAIANADLVHSNPADPYSSPLVIASPFRALSVDWWETDRTGAKDLKVWAGTMESFGIAYAMQQAIRDKRFHGPDLLDIGMVVTNPHDPRKKKEPFYFDSRRAPNAHSRDVGFSPNDMQLTSIAHPAVELLCLIGLQVARPANTAVRRVYQYFTWSSPLASSLLLAASTGSLAVRGQQAYRFENWFRTGQKKHKAFRSAVPIS
jgi:CRISPR-associated protein Csx14